MYQQLFKASFKPADGVTHKITCYIHKRDRATYANPQNIAIFIFNILK